MEKFLAFLTQQARIGNAKVRVNLRTENSFETEEVTDSVRKLENGGFIELVKFEPGAYLECVLNRLL